MSLWISTWDPAGKQIPPFEGDWSFGFERYRTELWGTDVVRSLGAVLIPQLASQGLYVENADLGALELEVRRIADSVEMIAGQLFEERSPGPGAVVVQSGESSAVHNAWGGRTPADSINRYLDNLQRAIDLARSANCGIRIE